MDAAAADRALAPDLCEPVLGYRFWRVDRHGALRCLVTRDVWEPGVNRARCWRRGHRAPGRLCDCGFNALHLLPERDRDQYRHAVLGALAAWGEIDVHRLGFRAEFARVVALADGGVAHPPSRRQLERVATRYGVPLVPVAELAAAARRHASPISPLLIPGRGPLPAYR